KPHLCFRSDTQKLAAKLEHLRSVRDAAQKRHSEETALAASTEDALYKASLDGANTAPIEAKHVAHLQRANARASIVAKVDADIGMIERQIAELAEREKSEASASVVEAAANDFERKLPTLRKLFADIMEAVNRGSYQQSYNNSRHGAFYFE